MLQNERKQYILELINRDRIVRAADLVERLGVSMETIRRDLEELEKAGNLRRSLRRGRFWARFTVRNPPTITGR